MKGAKVDKSGKHEIQSKYGKGGVFMDTMHDYIEEECDSKIFEEYEKDKATDKLKTRPIAELWKELDLD